MCGTPLGASLAPRHTCGSANTRPGFGAAARAAATANPKATSVGRALSKWGAAPCLPYVSRLRENKTKLATGREALTVCGHGVRPLKRPRQCSSCLSRTASSPTLLLKNAPRAPELHQRHIVRLELRLQARPIAADQPAPPPQLLDVFTGGRCAQQPHRRPREADRRRRVREIEQRYNARVLVSGALRCLGYSGCCYSADTLSLDPC